MAVLVRMKLYGRFMVLTLILLFALISGTAQNPVITTIDSVSAQVILPEDSSSTFNLARIDSIISLGKTFINKPYRYRGPSQWPMDCSGYLKYIYGAYGFDLPHSSGAIGKVVAEVDLKDLRKGDFLFFKGRSISSPHIGHVAMVVEVIDDDTVLMMHSTVKSGIIIEKYPAAYYYPKRFVKAGRLPAFIN